MHIENLVALFFENLVLLIKRKKVERGEETKEGEEKKNKGMGRKGSEWMEKEGRGDRREEKDEQARGKEKRENKRQITVEVIKKF